VTDCDRKNGSVWKANRCGRHAVLPVKIGLGGLAEQTITVPSTLHELEQERCADEASGDYWAQTRLGVFTSWIDEGDYERILDVGCGSGYLTRHLRMRGHSVAGLERERESLDVGMTYSDRGVFVRADARDAPFMDASFDCLVLADVYEHLERPEPLLDECRRLLVPGGHLLISVPAFRFLYGPHDEHNDHLDRYTASRLTNQLAQAGFASLRTRYTNVLPLVPYFVTQRVLRRDVPAVSRGTHNEFIERVKRLFIDVEVRVPWPAGITLMGAYRLSE